ncbi:MAG: pyridoxamine 5'-phosphate oxidase family protein [Lachnospiraceae bacterium]
MFREMRRKRQTLSPQLAEELLTHAKTGILAVTGDDGYPYTIPLNYVYKDSVLYFHCARSGHKLDALQSNPKVSFCIIEKDDVIPEAFTTHYRSVVAFGHAAEITADEEKFHVMQMLNDKYSPGLQKEGDLEIKRLWDILCVIGIKIDYISGKEAKELARERED